MTTVKFKVRFDRGGPGGRTTAEVDRRAVHGGPTERIPRVARLMALAIKFDGLLRDRTVKNLADLQVLLQTRRLRIAQALPEAAILTKELETFQVKITAAANETFGAWREGQHDDLVLATGLAAWAGEKALCGEGPCLPPHVIRS